MTSAAVLLPPSDAPFVLASSSARRLELLEQIHLSPTCIDPADIDEEPFELEVPKNYATRIATAKAMTVSERHSESFILAADTVVACGRRIMPKAETHSDAEYCLKKLSGRRHTVYGAVSLITPNGQILKRLVTTIVNIKRLDHSEITFYLASEQWRGKAGGYAIQGLAGSYIKNIRGSYTNVVGLPLYETKAMLTGLGFKYDFSIPGIIKKGQKNV